MRQGFSLYEVIVSLALLSGLLFIFTRFIEINLNLTKLTNLSKEKTKEFIKKEDINIYVKNSYFNGTFYVPIFTGIVDINKSSGNIVYLSGSKLTLLDQNIVVKFTNSDEFLNAMVIDDNKIKILKPFFITKFIDLH